MITLGIIGIVAALTLPTLVQHHRKQVVETRLMKFYSSINQAVKMAELDYGDKKDWYNDYAEPMYDKYGKEVQGKTPKEKWFNKYLRPYLKILKVESSEMTLDIYFPDGGMFRLDPNYPTDYAYYPTLPQGCREARGYCVFSFNFKPDDKTNPHLYNKGVEPYYWLDASLKWEDMADEVRTIKDYCYGIQNAPGTDSRMYCTAVIQQNGWKIPDDYPYKVR